MKILAVALAIYAAYLPAAWFVHRDYVPRFRPTGQAVEMIPRFDFDHPDRYVARSYVLGPAKYPDTSQISVYEGISPLPVEKVQFTADGPAYIVRIRASDGSDPRTNGRQYWLVAR